MDRTFEEMLVRQCAPTLAGLKPGSLFCITAEDLENVRKKVRFWDQRLEVLGLVDEAHYLAYEYVPLAVHELIAGLGQGAGTLCGVQVALCGRGLRQALTSLSGAASAVTACARAGRSVRPAPCRKRARARPAGVSKGAPSPGPAWPGCCGPRTCPG